LCEAMRIGELRIRFLRVMHYIGALSSLAGFLTVLRVYGFSGWLVVCALPFFLAVFYLDNRYVIHGETDYQNRNNADLQQIKKDLAEIKEKLG